MKKTLFIVGLALAFASTVSAEVDKKVTATLEKKLSLLIPGQDPSSIKSSAIDGLYEVTYGSQVFYISGDGNYLVQGDIIDLETRTNLTNQAANSWRSKVMQTVKDKDTITYAPKGKTEHTVTVFTDIDCPYCVKLHEEIQAYNDAGIAVRYLMYPRAGVGSPSYKKAVSVWCADDSKAAMTKAKIEQKVEMKTCDNPVKTHMAMAAEMGVTGTPAIVLDDGYLIPGYQPAKSLARALNNKIASNKK